MGLPMAALVAKAGYTVKGVDVQQRVVDAINNGQTHFEEPGLAPLVEEQAKLGNLTAYQAPQQAEIFVIAVPTPFNEEDKTPDMTYVRQAAESLASVLKEGDLVILESTSPIGSTEADVRDVIEAKAPELKGKVLYAFCPERAIPGDTMRELIENDRCVGGVTEEATQKALEFYKTFIKGELIPTTARVAEMVKLVENSSRDAQIAFANELSLVCDKLDMNVWEVIQLANRHPRVNILRPGTGVGGHCLAVDPWFIVNSAPDVTPLIRTVRQVNDHKPQWVVDKIKAALYDNPNATVVLMGLAFKPDVEDLRNSPSMLVAKWLKEQAPNANILACEPHNIEDDAGFALVPQEQAVEQGDVLVFLTSHTVFKQIPQEQLATKTVIDPSGTFA